MSSIELGQLLISNTPVQSYEANWATDGLHMIAQVIAESRGEDPLGGWTTLTSNSGSTEYVNDVFEMRSYCWCDGERKGHEKECPPNFVFNKYKVNITWYKHAGRGITCNKEFPGMKKWFEVISECIRSI